MLADSGSNTKSEHTCGSSITPTQVNDIRLVRYLAIGQYEALARALGIWCHLQEMLKRRQDLSATQVSLELLDVLCRLLQACLIIGPWSGPQGGKGGAKTHDVERVVGCQRPHTECQGALRLRD